MPRETPWQRRLRKLRVFLLALLIAGLAHAIAWVLIWGRWGDTDLLRVLPPRLPTEQVPQRAVTAVQLAPSQLANLPEIPLSALRGGADETGSAQTHPLPDQRVELPGPRAASAGGGATAAGETAATERSDRADDVPIRHERWNGKRDYQSEHERTARTSQSPEAIHQRPDPATSDRPEAQRVASAGIAAPIAGSDPATLAHAGAVRPSNGAPLVEPGPARADVPLHGATADDTNSAAASSAMRTGPYEITPPGAGGPAPSGVVGAPAPGSVANGTGTAATTAHVAPGPRDLTVTADRQDPYFRLLFARLEKSVTYPKDLALDLRSGRPIAIFTIRPDGAIDDASIALPARDAGFDRELLRAIKALGKLSPPPARLAGARVRLEWVFDPGILR